MLTFNKKVQSLWGCSSVGRAPALQAGGRQFESDQLHHQFSLLRAKRTIKKIECRAVAFGEGGHNTCEIVQSCCSMINTVMAGVAQLVRALFCGTKCRQFESGHPPHK